MTLILMSGSFFCPEENKTRFEVRKPQTLCENHSKITIFCVFSYLLASSTATATATVIPTMGLLPLTMEVIKVLFFCSHTLFLSMRMFFAIFYP